MTREASTGEANFSGLRFRMHIILGGTGHIGSALAKILSGGGERVKIITRDAAKAQQSRQRGIEAAVADVNDAEALREVFRTGRRLFLLNPPADPATDTDAEERRSLASIMEAINGSGLEKIVAESTYGAQQVERGGDLGILFSMEQQLASQAIPYSVIRAAYYMSNWDAVLATARKDGEIHSFYPTDFTLPMVAPYDIAKVAAHLMTAPVEQTGTYHAEGPETYTPADVAAAFGAALSRPVRVVVTPREKWESAFKALGFSDPAADSYARMTALTLDNKYPPPADPFRGEITLTDYVGDLVRASAG